MFIFQFEKRFSIHSTLKTLQIKDCYQIGGKLFSLIEIEHCILRAPLSKPQFVGSSLFIPKFQKKDPRIKNAAKLADPRINFVLNCGSHSSPYFVWPIDGGDEYDMQMDHASWHFIQDQVFVNHEKRIIDLPKICQWYMDDFGNKNALLQFVAKYLTSAQNADIKNLMESGNYKIRFTEYDWKFRGFFFAGENHLTSCHWLKLQ